jgi:hypothetical protein
MTTRITLFFLVATHVIGLIGTATLLHDIERDDYSDRRYVKRIRLWCRWV